MATILSDPQISLATHSADEAPVAHTPDVIAYAAWHSLFWLVFANAVGVLLATLLLFPGLNSLLGEWTYGRWMPVHINIQLYGWISLPLVAFLFKAYGCDRKPVSGWCRPILWLWSSALAVGAVSWLGGHSSGKLFLDWTGFARIYFPLALLALWLLLAVSLRCNWKSPENSFLGIKVTKLLSLALLLVIPFLIYIAASPSIYPPINPDSGGPTGASQLESVLVIVSILLLLPQVLCTRVPNPSKIVRTAWVVFIVEAILCVGLGRADVSHHRPTQYIALGSLLVWVPLVPAYYAKFIWHANAQRWRVATLVWWAVLVPTGWCLFLPGVLDHFKFTDGLVGHSLLAMAGFASSLLILVMVQLLGEAGWIFNGDPWFYMWQLSVAAYVALMFTAGWQEGSNPGFSMVPGFARNLIYALRLVLGVLMLVASAYWLLDASKLLREGEASA